MGMGLEARRTGAGEVILWLGAMTLSAMIGAVLALVVIATPIDRAGRSIFHNFIEPVFAGQNPLTGKSLELEGGSQEDILPQQASLPDSIKPRFIVRFDQEVQAVNALRAFRENRARGRELFAEWSSREDRFAGFSLEGLTPSGEAVISYDGIGSDKPDATLLRQLTRQLTDAPYVIYADPFQFFSLIQ